MRRVLHEVNVAWRQCLRWNGGLMCLWLALAAANLRLGSRVLEAADDFLMFLYVLNLMMGAYCLFHLAAVVFRLCLVYRTVRENRQRIKATLETLEQ